MNAGSGTVGARNVLSSDVGDKYLTELFNTMEENSGNGRVGNTNLKLGRVDILFCSKMSLLINVVYIWRDIVR